MNKQNCALCSEIYAITLLKSKLLRISITEIIGHEELELWIRSLEILDPSCYFSLFVLKDFHPNPSLWVVGRNKGPRVLLFMVCGSVLLWYLYDHDFIV
jgi:hypothetical protein